MPNNQDRLIALAAALRAGAEAIGRVDELEAELAKANERLKFEGQYEDAYDKLDDYVYEKFGVKGDHSTYESIDRAGFDLAQAREDTARLDWLIRNTWCDEGDRLTDDLFESASEMGTEDDWETDESVPQRWLRAAIDAARNRCQR